MVTLDQVALLELAAKRLYPNYRPAPFVLTSGRGSEIWDQTGKRYLDLCAGIAVTVLGHAHPRYVAALSEQAARLVHVSNYFYTDTNILLGDQLCIRTGMDRVFFCNSGTEANEAMLKLARRHFYSRGQKDRYRIVAFEKAFHGRTLGSLSLTGTAAYREGFGPYEGGVTHVPYGDLDAVRAVMGRDVAAIIVEPIEGEGGVLPAPPGFLAGLRVLADGAGALLLVDEVQTGIGRTGTFLAIQAEGVQPDAVSLAKGLAGGFPMGAMLCREALAGALPPGTHASTFGGNPLASAAALAVLAVLDDEKLVEQAQTKGEALSQLLSKLTAKYPHLAEPERGRGLLRALPLRLGVSAPAVVAELRARGVLVTVSGDSALRFTPPLVITVAQLEEGCRTLDEVLGATVV